MMSRVVFCTSPSSRRAWIEIVLRYAIPPPYAVALLAEGVDRNYAGMMENHGTGVALLTEGVGRNQLAGPQMPSAAVALLAEGVDRNRAAV